jgi:hypothetical protein
MLDGKQVKDGTVAASKLVASFLATLLRNDGSITWTGAQNAGSQRITNLGAPTVDTDAARLADIYAIPWKDKVKCATTANVILATGGLLTIDTIATIAGDRVLVRAQTTGTENGIYIVASGAWTRAADSDTASELRGAFVTVEQGTLYADHRFAQTADSIVLGTTALVWVDTGVGTPAAFDTASNKAMTASVTTADFQIATVTTLAFKPSGIGSASSYVRVQVNGIGINIGDGVKTKESYFSADSGATAKTIANLATGDSLYWVGSVAGYQLAATDSVDFDYAV